MKQGSLNFTAKPSKPQPSVPQQCMLSTFFNIHLEPRQQGKRGSGGPPLVIGKKRSSSPTPESRNELHEENKLDQKRGKKAEEKKAQEDAPAHHR